MSRGTHETGAEVPRHSLTALPTSEVTLRPSLIEGLKRIAPKRQRPWGLYVFALALLAVVAGLAATRSVREIVVANVRQLVSRHADPPVPDAPGVAPAASSAAVPPDAPASAAASVTPVVRAPASATASASSTTLPGPKKPRRPPHR